MKVRKRHSPRSKAIIILPAATSSSSSMHTFTVMPTCPEYDALGFFFLRYSTSQDLDATCSFFGILPDLYAKSAASSPLNQATKALALQVAHLHRTPRGGNRTSPRGGEHYAKAVSQIKRAVTVPAQCRSNELLLATLVLGAYDNTNTTFGRREGSGGGGGGSCSPRSSAHLRGSIALLQYRGTMSYGDELSWLLLTATRNRLLHDPWQSADRLVAMETIQKIWEHGGGGAKAKGPRRPAVEADTLAFRLSWLRYLYRATTFTTSPSPSRGRAEHHHTRHMSVMSVMSDACAGQLKDILSQASHLANDCALLQSSLPLRWQPASVSASFLATSIQIASVYEHVTPTVYSRLSIAHSINRQRLTELECISLIGSCLADLAATPTPTPPDEPSGAATRRRGLLPSALLARAQSLVDEICASVPFMTGNMTAGTSSPMTPLVPFVVPPMSPGEMSKGNRTLPEDMTRHTQEVVASGLYMMYSTLKVALDLTGRDNKMVDVGGNLLRAGQDEWMAGQVNRLGNILPLANASL